MGLALPAVLPARRASLASFTRHSAAMLGSKPSPASPCVCDVPQYAGSHCERGSVTQTDLITGGASRGICRMRAQEAAYDRQHFCITRVCN